MKKEMTNLKGITDSILIFGTNTEAITFVFNQIRNQTVSAANKRCSFFPVVRSGTDVQTLNNIIGDFGASIVFRNLPREAARVGSNVVGFKRTFWR
jgi:hypothetical protein